MKKIVQIFWQFVRWWCRKEQTIHRSKWENWIFEDRYVCHTCCWIWKKENGKLPEFHYMDEGYERTNK